MFTADFKEKSEKEIPLPGKKHEDMVAFLQQIHPLHCGQPITDDMTDVIFVVEDRKLYFNKTILMMCSPVFKSMFTSRFKEKEAKEIPLPDKKYEDVVVLTVRRMAGKLETEDPGGPFETPDDTTDVIFIVEQKKLYFNKMLLGMCSPVFKRMFTADFKEKSEKEIPLPGKKHEDMVAFLQQIHPLHCGEPITEKVKAEPGTVTGPFDVPDDTTDVTFLIEDKKIYFNRVVLVMASPAFKQAFSACDHKSKGEKLIPLPGKKYVDMVAFLKQIHPAHCAEPITDETLPEILLLADEYEVASVRQKCEEYINTQIRLDVCQPMSDYRVLFYLTVAEKHSFQMLRQQLCVEDQKKNWA
nr:hypothetical protein BaRGS_011546 [Batillaria attramentaria]